MKNYGIIIDDWKIRLGKNVCTIYTIDLDDDHAIKIILYNMVYVRSTDSFCFNKNLNLPKKIIKMYDGTTTNIDQKIEEMEAIGIIRLATISEKIMSFEKLKNSIKYTNYRNKILGKSKSSLENSSESSEIINEIETLRKELLANSKNIDNASLLNIRLNNI